MCLSAAGALRVPEPFCKRGSSGPVLCGQGFLGAELISEQVNPFIVCSVCVCLLFRIILYVNCFGRTVLYMCVEYHI